MPFTVSCLKPRFIWIYAFAAVLCWTSHPCQAQETVGADDVIRLGSQQLAYIDLDRTAEVWQAASPVLKAQLGLPEFAAGIRAGRGALAVIPGRSWVLVNRVTYGEGSDAGVPAGRYASVNYLTDLGGKRILSELVSFRLEADGRWRLSGYVPKFLP